MPTEAERKEIFTVLLRRNKRDPKSYNIDKLAETAVDFTGAEIENVITSAMYDRFALDGKQITTTNLMDEILATQPLAKTAAADIEHMRKNAEGKLRVATSSGAVKALASDATNSGRRTELSL